MLEPSRNMLRKQFLITTFMEQKLQVVNFIKDGYDENKPILVNNRFLHFTAHIYYRSIIVDLYALFGKANANNRYSFFHITLKFKTEFKEEAIEMVKEWLSLNNDFILIIEKLRHEQIAHYDFNQDNGISLNFDELFILNDLYNLAKKIIRYLGESTKNKDDGMGFGFDRRHDKIDSLERLIAKAARK